MALLRGGIFFLMKRFMKGRIGYDMVKCFLL